MADEKNGGPVKNEQRGVLVAGSAARIFNGNNASGVSVFGQVEVDVEGRQAYGVRKSLVGWGEEWQEGELASVQEGDRVAFRGQEVQARKYTDDQGRTWYPINIRVEEVSILKE